MLLWMLNIILMAIAAILLIPTGVFCIECLAALLPARRSRHVAPGSPRPRVVVLMPAHNEEFGIDPAIQSVLPQLQAGDRILVVADNCTDATAAVARSAGVEVVERTDPLQRGKGFALDFGLTHLEADPPDVVIILDSDCLLHDGSIEALARQVQSTGRPAQAIYLLARPANSHPRDAVSSLAFLVKNLVRPRGLDRLGLPCLLTGAGMALPWQQVRGSKMATGNIVEDLQLGIDLTLAGHAPRLCVGAFVTGELPGQRHAAIGQRRRWEHGYIQTAIRTVPHLAAGALRSVSINRLGIALELTVPPLALLVLALTLATSITTSTTLLGTTHRVPIILASGLLAVLACIAASWFRFGRHRVPAAALLGCPSYLLGKIPLYAGFAFQRETQWIRTARAGEVHEGDLQPGSSSAGAAESRLPTIVLQGIRFTCVTEQQCVDHVMNELAENRGGELVTPNLDHLRRCRHDPAFAGLVAQSQVVVADGMPLVWASRLQGTPLPERVAGSDLISSISAAAAERGRSVFLLGGAPDAAQRAAEVLKTRYPNLTVTGTHCPAMGFDLNPEAMAEIIDRLTMAKPDIIYVALGSPKQELLIQELREWLPRAWWLGVGYSFSFLAGDGRRAPRWMQRTGLEWAHRLFREPRRLARRYLIEGLPYAAHLLTATAFNGLTGRQIAAVLPPPNLAKPGTQHRLGNGPDQGELAALVYSSFARGLGVELARPPRKPQAYGPRLRIDGRAGRLSAFVLLGGTLRPSPFLAAIKRSILDMPIQDGRRLLSNWQHQTSELAQFEGLDQLPLRVLVDSESPAPAAAPASSPGSISIERDAARYRGTGGLLRDLAQSYDDDEFLLVANGGQLLTHPLVDLVRELHETKADVSFIAHQDGTPSSVMLIRCGALRGISKSGYVDLKEQAMPIIAKSFKVAHVDHAWPTCLPLRSHKDYLAVVRWWHLHRSFQSMGEMLQESESLLENHSFRFSIVEPGAIVDPTACLQDCVVLRGARVGPGAVAVRSVLCAGSELGANESAVDQLVSVRSRAQTARTQRILQFSRS